MIFAMLTALSKRVVIILRINQGYSPREYKWVQVVLSPTRLSVTSRLFFAVRSMIRGRELFRVANGGKVKWKIAPTLVPGLIMGREQISRRSRLKRDYMFRRV